MRHFEKEGNVLTLRDTMHYAPCDIPTVVMGSWMRLPFTWLFRSNEEQEQALPASKALDVCSQIAVRYFSTTFDASSGKSDQLSSYLDSIDDYVIHGTSYIDTN